MAWLIPETTTRLQATAFVTNAELSAMGRTSIIRMAAEQLAERALRKLMDDCIKIKEYEGHPGKRLDLDVYVLAPHELHKMLADARRQGERDALNDRVYR